MAKKAKPIRMCSDRRLTPAQLRGMARLAQKIEPSNVLPGVDQVIADGVLLPIKAANLYGKKWKNGQEISVAFMGGTAAQKKFVRETVEREIAPYVNLKFVWFTDRDAPDKALIRITFDPAQGAYSYIGIDCLGIPKTEPTLNLGWLDIAVVVHEFLHALSLIHEHQHPLAELDWHLEAVYAFYGGPPNYWSRATTKRNILDKYAIAITQYSAYDPKSVMHYAIDGRLLKDPSRAVGWNDRMSDTDRWFIQSQYPKAEPPPPPPPPPKKIYTVELPARKFELPAETRRFELVNDKLVPVE